MITKGTVSIPADYFFKMATVDYRNWKEALPREFFQNSIDAKAKEISVSYDNEERSVTIVDDGIGMSFDIIQNKLLVLGGSAKDVGSVGAFGKAKELLYFSWPKWSILTRNFYVEGSSSNYTITTRSAEKYYRGTISKIYLNNEYADIIVHFCKIAKKMDTKTTIKVGGVPVYPNEHKGRLVKSLPFGNLYCNKSIENPNMQVRINGIWMFDTYIGYHGKTFIFDLTKSSMDCLTSNRDGLRWEYSSGVGNLVRDIIANSESISKEKPSLFKQIIKGEGKITFDIPGLEDIVNVYKNKPVQALNSLINVIRKVVPDVNENLLKARLISSKTIDHISVKMFGYKPDFVILYGKKQKSIVKRFMNTKKAAVIANIWTEILKQVMIDNKICEEFTAGFCFNPDEDALFSSENGNIVIYLNPLNIGSKGGWQNKAISNRLFLSEDLKDKAIHEVSHFYHTDHNEPFVCKMHELRAHTHKSHKIYSKIARMK